MLVFCLGLAKLYDPDVLALKLHMIMFMVRNKKGYALELRSDGNMRIWHTVFIYLLVACVLKRLIT